MTLTKAQLKRASKIAVRNMNKVLPTLPISRLKELKALCNATFIPNLSKEDKRNFLKGIK